MLPLGFPLATVSEGSPRWEFVGVSPVPLPVLPEHSAVLTLGAPVATVALPLPPAHPPRLPPSLQFRFPSENSVESIQKVMKSPTGGAASPTSSWAPSLPPRAAAAVPRAWRAPVPPRAQLPGVLTLPRPRWPIQLGFGRSSGGGLVLSRTSPGKEGAEEAWLGAGEGQNLQPKVPRGTVSSPPVQCGLDQFGRLQQ